MLTVRRSDDWWGAHILLKPRRSFRPGSPLSLECLWQPSDVSSVSRRSPWLSGFEGMPTQEGKHHCVTHFSVFCTSKNCKFMLFHSKSSSSSFQTIAVTLKQTKRIEKQMCLPYLPAHWCLFWVGGAHARHTAWFYEKLFKNSIPPVHLNMQAVSRNPLSGFCGSLLDVTWMGAWFCVRLILFRVAADLEQMTSLAPRRCLDQLTISCLSASLS